MATAISYSIKGVEGEKTNLPKNVFSSEIPDVTLAQAVRVQLSNKRRGMAKTKTRGLVEKTTAKMYKQKGTGNARHGSYSAPIFVGGGIAFGPDGAQNYSKKLQRNVSRKTLLSAMTIRAADNACCVLDLGTTKILKTKDAAIWIEKVIKNPKSILVTTAANEAFVRRAFRNIPKVLAIPAQTLNTYAVLSHESLVVTESALAELQKQHDR